MTTRSNLFSSLSLRGGAKQGRSNLLTCIGFLLLCFSFSSVLYLSSYAAIKDKKVEGKKEEETKKEPINEKEFEPVLLGALLNNPESFLEKKIKFRGKFSSFSTLALDYEPALRKAKDYISLTIFRPNTKIPLSELKLAFPVKDAKENEVIRELEEEDLLEFYGKVFSAALDEPWVDVLEIKKLESASKIKTETTTKKDEDEKKAKSKNKKSKKKIEKNNE